MVNSFDMEKELKRHADCADKLYEANSELPTNTSEEIHHWATSMRDIVKEYDITPLLAYITNTEDDLLKAKNDEQRRSIKSAFQRQLQVFFDKKKCRIVDLASRQQSNRNEYCDGPFKVVYSAQECQQHVYIDGVELEYIPPANEQDRQNYQWIPLLIAFIRDPSHSLSDIKIENTIHTTSLRAIEESIRKLKAILEANHHKNPSMSRVRIRKVRQENYWILEVAK